MAWKPKKNSGSNNNQARGTGDLWSPDAFFEDKTLFFFITVDCKNDWSQ